MVQAPIRREIVFHLARIDIHRRSVASRRVASTVVRFDAQSRRARVQIFSLLWAIREGREAKENYCMGKQ